MSKQSLMAFLQELESHCSSSAIATFLDSDGKSFVIDLNRNGNRVSYGYEKDTKQQLIDKLLRGTQPYGALILRSFTSEIDELTQLPIKELRGYTLKNQGDNLEFEKLPPNIVFACQNTDAETGEPLPLEQSVRYC
ncbi:MAG: hypothetical protein AB4426_13775 [Xenococcaceae cyanobacterium]